MKFSHIADVHIGSWRDPKLKELSSLAFIEAIDESIKEKVDFILIAGDLFNTAIPGIDLIKTVIRKLKEAKKANIPVYYIAGSHDFSPSGKTMLDIIEEAELGINVTKGEIDEEDKLRLQFTIDQKTGVKITGMIGKRGMLEKKYYEALNLNNLEAEKGFKIFMFHTAIDELKPEYLKDMESTPASFLPKGFDYYAGGHVHIVAKKDLSEHGYKQIVYPGPTFPANFSELEKLGTGGFYIYHDGELNRKNIEIKKSLYKEFVIDGKTAVEANSLILKELEDTDVNDKIILLRVHGKLKEGRTSDIDFKEILEELYNRKAYYVMKNTNKITSDEFKAVITEYHSAEEVEDKIIQEHLGQTPHIFSDEAETIQKLMRTFSEEKNEGEKASDYEDRIKKDADVIIK